MASKPNITKMYSQAWLHPNKPPKGVDATKQSKWPQRPTSNKYTKGKQARTKQMPRSKQTSMDPNINTWIKGKKNSKKN